MGVCGSSNDKKRKPEIKKNINSLKNKEFNNNNNIKNKIPNKTI